MKRLLVLVLLIVAGLVVLNVFDDIKRYRAISEM
jgi:hypothetical protein